jgi:hypothetical protein
MNGETDILEDRQFMVGCLVGLPQVADFQDGLVDSPIGSFDAKGQWGTFRN